MSFLRRFFSKQNERPEVEERERVEERMQSTLKEQYQHDVEEDVSSIESILEGKEDKPEESTVLPAPDYDEHDATVDDVLADLEMESFSEKNTVEHASVEDIGNHLESAIVVGDVPDEVSFEAEE